MAARSDADARFRRAQHFVARWEGGYADDPDDRGGATNMGISLRFLKGLSLEDGDIDGDGDIDAADIRKLTPDKADALYRRYFWDIFPLDGLPEALAFAIYDSAVNCGVYRVRKLAQKALGVKADGKWGPVTWAALEGCDAKATALEVLMQRRLLYERIVERNPSQGKYLHGWLRRVAAAEERVKELSC